MGIPRASIEGTQIPMDLVIRSYSFERQPVIYNYDPTSVAPDDGAAALAGDNNKILGGFTEPSDPNIKGQYVREFLLGADREVMPNVGGKPRPSGPSRLFTVMLAALLE